jgi:hypothetical protein
MRDCRSGAKGGSDVNRFRQFVFRCAGLDSLLAMNFDAVGALRRQCDCNRHEFLVFFRNTAVGDRGLVVLPEFGTAARPDWRILLVRSKGSTQTLLEGKDYERDSSPIGAEDFLIKQKQRPCGPKSGPASARALILLGIDLEKLKEALGSAADSWELKVGDTFLALVNSQRKSDYRRATSRSHWPSCETCRWSSVDKCSGVSR